MANAENTSNGADAAHPDAQILKTVAEIVFLEGIIDGMPMEADADGNRPWKRCLPYYGEMQGHIARLAAMPARTRLGLLAKLSVVRCGLGQEYGPEAPDKALLRAVLHEVSEALA